MADQISRFLQYLYFVRFSIILWLLLPVLAILDWMGVTTSFTRGIFALESKPQAFWASFFVVATGVVVLITTRVVAANGRDRFLVDAPATLQRLFGSQSHERTWWALALAEAPGLAVLVYVGATSDSEIGLTWQSFVWSSLFGIMVAAGFWLVVSLFYYWTFSASTSQASEGIRRSIDQATPLIFPPGWFSALEEAEPPRFARYLARVRLLSRLSYPGYAPSQGALLWELHSFSIVAIWGFILLYLLLLPISAPVTLPSEMLFLFIFGVIPAAALMKGTLHRPWKQATVSSTRATILAKLVFLVVTVGVILAWLVCLLVPRYMPRAERGMPTLASLMVLAILLTWVFSSGAFFLDRFRVPVLTILLLIVFLPKFFKVNTEEHYYSVITMASARPAAPVPAEVLSLRKKDSGPLVIITATGGGIHAAGWTAEILSQLERRFSTNEVLKQGNYTLHDHILLASGVWGEAWGWHSTSGNIHRILRSIRDRVSQTVSPSMMFERE